MTTVGPSEIIEAVARHYGVQPRILRGPGRCRSIALPRAVGMYLTRNLTDLSYPKIGNFYGGRDHATVIAAERKVERWLDPTGPDCRPSVADDMIEIRAQIASESVDSKRSRLEAVRAGLARQMEQLDLALEQLNDFPARRAA